MFVFDHISIDIVYICVSYISVHSDQLEEECVELKRCGVRFILTIINTIGYYIECHTCVVDKKSRETSRVLDPRLWAPGQYIIYIESVFESIRDRFVTCH